MLLPAHLQHRQQSRQEAWFAAALFEGGEDTADDVADVASAALVPCKIVKAAPAPKVEEPATPRPGITIVIPDQGAPRCRPDGGRAGAPTQEIKLEASENIVAALSECSSPAGVRAATGTRCDYLDNRVFVVRHNHNFAGPGRWRLPVSVGKHAVYRPRLAARARRTLLIL